MKTTNPESGVKMEPAAIVTTGRQYTVRIWAKERPNAPAGWRPVAETDSTCEAGDTATALEAAGWTVHVKDTPREPKPAEQIAAAIATLTRIPDARVTAIIDRLGGLPGLYWMTETGIRDQLQEAGYHGWDDTADQFLAAVTIIRATIDTDEEERT